MSAPNTLNGWVETQRTEGEVRAVREDTKRLVAQPPDEAFRDDPGPRYHEERARR